MKRQSEGHQAVRAWNPTWRHHHIPLWIRKRIRARAKNRCLFQSQGYNEFDYIINNEQWSDLFDHWGSAKNKGSKDLFFATQPYGRPLEQAKLFAAETRCSVMIVDPAPYGGSSIMYIFKPLQERSPDAR